MSEFAYVVNVDCAVLRNDEYLTIERAAGEEHAAGLLSFPGGKLESPPDGADALAATAAREVREETGVEVRAVEYVTSATFEDDRGRQCLNVVTRGAYAGGEAHPREPGEVAATRWLPYDALKRREDLPPFVEDYLDAVEASRADA